MCDVLYVSTSWFDTNLGTNIVDCSIIVEDAVIGAYVVSILFESQLLAPLKQWQVNVLFSLEYTQ
jgi:hypothetical protein